MANRSIARELLLKSIIIERNFACNRKLLTGIILNYIYIYDILRYLLELLNGILSSNT